MHEDTRALADKDVLIQEIDGVLALVDADVVNLCLLLLRLIERSADTSVRSELLKYAAENFGARQSSKEIAFEPEISRNNLEELTSRLGGLVNEMLDVLLRDNESVEVFYERLDEILHNPLLRKEQDQAFAFYWVLIDTRIPYFQLAEGLKMSNEDWRILAKKHRLQRAKIRFIVNSTFSQRSEEADLILKELDSSEPYDRIYLMGAVLSEVRTLARREGEIEGQRKASRQS